MSYRRESRRLTQTDVDSYVEYAASENGVKGVMEIGDVKTVGLTLRIIPGKAVWYVRRREVTIRLAEAQYVPLEDARYYAEQIRLNQRRNPRCCLCQ